MKIAISKFSRRRLGHSVQNVAAVSIAVAAAFFASSTVRVSAGTESSFTGSSSVALTTASNYSPAALPTNTTDVLITTSRTAALTDNANTSLQMESLSLTDSSPNSGYTISNPGATSSTLTLGNSAGFTNAYSSTANDLIYLQDTNLTIKGTGAYSTLGLTLASNGNFDLVTGTYSTTPTLTISAVISGGYGITTTGSGTVVLSGNNAFTGGISNSSSGTLTLSGTNAATSFSSSAGTVELAASSALGSVSTVNISGSAVVYDSILSLSGVINSSAAVSLSGTGGLQTEGSNQTVGSLTGTSSARLFIGDYVGTSATTAGSFTVGDSTSTTYAGAIIGTYSETTGALLTKQGTGTLTLSGANTYTGPTMISAGTLIVNGTNSGTGAVTVGDGNTLKGTLGGVGTIAGATTVNVGSTITGATVGTVGTLTITNPLTINGTYVADVAATTSDKLSLTGTSTAGILTLGSTSTLSLVVSGTLTAAQYVLATYASLSGTFSTVTGVPSGYMLDYGTVTAGEITLDPTPVPEPATWLGGALLTGIVGYSQRRRLQGLLLAATNA